MQVPCCTVLTNGTCTPQEFPEPDLPAETVAAFETAFNNIHKFHTAQKQAIPLQVETMPGVQCRRLSKPIGVLTAMHISSLMEVLITLLFNTFTPLKSAVVVLHMQPQHSASAMLHAHLTCSSCNSGAVGIYVPGGTAVLPSSALMLSVPAGIAGCKTIVLATPPRSDGTITPEVVWCAKRAGVTHILKAGGAQAVAAMAWGTQSCPKVRSWAFGLILTHSKLYASSVRPCPALVVQHFAHDALRLSMCL